MNPAAFAERLGELLFERGMTGKDLAAAIHISASAISRYLHVQRMPAVENLVLLADFFSCSVEFLLGRRDSDPAVHFCKCPPFSQQIVRLAQIYRLSFYAFCRSAGIPESSFYEWKNGTSAPTLESIERLADHFGCSVDFILGREC